MNIILIILVAILILIIPVTIYLYRWIPFQERKRMMINLGFSEIRFLESYVSTKIRRLIQTPVKKKNIYRFSSEGAQFLVIFSNLPSLFNKEEIYSIIVISEKLQLPRFTLTSKLNITNRLDSIMNSTMDQLAKLEAGAKNLHKIEIQAYPELNKRFVLLGEDEKLVIRFFSKERSKKIFQIKSSIELSANSDLFTIKTDVSQHNEISEENKMRRTINIARRIYRVLSN
jgi:hypothetical protein